MAKLTDLAPAEFEIMEILWKKGQASTKTIVAALPEARKLAYNTVATVLTRLRDKGYVQASEDNLAYIYRPLIDRRQVEDRKLDDLVHRILGGNLSTLAVYIARKSKLNPDQIAALEAIIESQPEKEV